MRDNSESGQPALSHREAAIAPPLAYSIAEAVRTSGLGRTTLYALIKSGTLPVVKVGSRTLIRHLDLQSLLDHHIVGSSTADL